MGTANITTDLDLIASTLASAHSVLFITGAGLSADSGLPTYRGIGGLYDDQDTPDGIAIEEALSGPMFRRSPEVVWRYIAQIEQACRGAKHNQGHRIIAAMEKHFDRVCVLTQNVDGLHRAAGSENLIDIHGDVHNLYCTQCDYTDYVADYSAMQIPPLCPKCKSIIRPDVVLFGEMLPIPQVSHLRQELQRGFDVVFSIGTTSVFPYIAGPVMDARGTSTFTVEINPGLTEVSGMVDARVEANAAATLDALWQRVRR